MRFAMLDEIYPDSTRVWAPRSDADKCRNLLAAVIERAIHDLVDSGAVTSGESARLIERNCRAWLTDTQTAKPFSFIWICEQLNLDADKLRKGIFLLEAKFHLGKLSADTLTILNFRVLPATDSKQKKEGR